MEFEKTNHPAKRTSLFKYFIGTIICSVLLVMLGGFTKTIKKIQDFSNSSQRLRISDTVISPAANYAAFCGGCHGEKMNAFVDRTWKHGNSNADLFKAIKFGYPDEGMPAFESAFDDQAINALAKYIITGIKNVDRYRATDAPQSNIFKTQRLTIRLDTVVAGLDVPWAMAFLPNNEMLITERNGNLYYRRKDGSLSIVKGTPQVVVAGQGGLLDIALDPDYNKNKFIYLSYSKGKKEDGKELATTAIMRARFDKTTLSHQTDIFIARPYSTTHHHYGSRMQFGRDGYLYFSVGERGNEKQNPQEIRSNDLGKIHRIKADGTIPSDNPFVRDTNINPSIYSYGHRNPQGMVVDPKTGKIWSNEHGPRGGDEVNLIEGGKNYGWPVITYGINYNGRPMSPDTKTSKEGMEQPIFQWTPSIAPSGMAFVFGNRYKQWEGNLMSGSLRFRYLNRSIFKKDRVVGEEILFKNIGRVRDIRMAPDGYLYMSVEKPGIIYRLTPIN